jgi:hypothetical protein
MVGSDALKAAEQHTPAHCHEMETDLIEDLLLALDCEVTPRNVRAVDYFIEQVATGRAGEVLRHWLLVLDGNVETVALRRVVLGDGGQSLRDAAKQSGISHVALWKAEARLRERLKLPPARIGEADERPNDK